MADEDPHEHSAGPVDESPGIEPSEPVALDARTAAVLSLNAIAEQGRENELLDIVERSLGAETSAYTYTDFFRAMWLLTGEYAVAGILAFICQADGDDFDEDVDPLGFSAAARQMVLTLSMRYGHRILAAWYQSERANAVRNDWTSIIPETRLEVESGDYSVTVAIVKKNRERFQVVGGANSMARWARIMLGIIVEIGDRRAFSEQDRDRLVARLDETRAILEEPTPESNHPSPPSSG